MEYVNKGKGDVSNVEASIEGGGITATQATQYIAMWRPALLVPSDSLSLRMRPANMMPS